MVRPLVGRLDALRERLAPAVHAAAVEALALRLAARMETDVLGKRFNELGAIQLQAEVRLISDALSAATDGSVRHCFARLTQVSFLLTASSVGEATALAAEAVAAADGADGDGAGGGTPVRARQRLSAAEVCRVMQLRVEFAGHDFASMFE